MVAEDCGYCPHCRRIDFNELNLKLKCCGRSGGGKLRAREIQRLIRAAGAGIREINGRKTSTIMINRDYF